MKRGASSLTVKRSEAIQIAEQTAGEIGVPLLMIQKPVRWQQADRGKQSAAWQQYLFRCVFAAAIRRKQIRNQPLSLPTIAYLMRLHSHSTIGQMIQTGTRFVEDGENSKDIVARIMQSEPPRPKAGDA